MIIFLPSAGLASISPSINLAEYWKVGVGEGREGKGRAAASHIGNFDQGHYASFTSIFRNVISRAGGSRVGVDSVFLEVSVVASFGPADVV